MRCDNQFLNQQRNVGDAAADDLVNSVFRSKNASILYESLGLSITQTAQSKTKNPVVEFLTQPPSPSIWLDEKRILKGQTVFEDHAVTIMSLLGIMSLPYCYAAYPGNKALYLTEKMRKSPGKRLAETGEFTLGVLRKGSLQKNGDGLLHINKTRLIHAVARYHLQKGNWNNDWGVPINQEDMAGTNLAFSYVILTGLQRSGVLLSDREKEDFLFVWKYIGTQLGITKELLPDNFQEARILAETIKSRTMRKTDEGITLTEELVAYYKKMLPPQQAYFVEYQIRYFLGEEVSEYLGLPKDLTQQNLVAFTNGIKEIQNLFSLPANQMPQLTANFQRMKATITNKNL